MKNMDACMYSHAEHGGKGSEKDIDLLRIADRSDLSIFLFAVRVCLHC